MSPATSGAPRPSCASAAPTGASATCAISCGRAVRTWSTISRSQRNDSTGRPTSCVAGPSHGALSSTQRPQATRGSAARSGSRRAMLLGFEEIEAALDLLCERGAGELLGGLLVERHRPGLVALELRDARAMVERQAHVRPLLVGLDLREGALRLVEAGVARGGVGLRQRLGLERIADALARARAELRRRRPGEEVLVGDDRLVVLARVIEEPRL